MATALVYSDMSDYRIDPFTNVCSPVEINCEVRVIPASNAIMYIDRIEVVCNNWNVNDVELKNVEYIITGTKKIANMEYSSNQLDVVKDLQELSDRLNETRNVFFKGST